MRHILLSFFFVIIFFSCSDNKYNLSYSTNQLEQKIKKLTETPINTTNSDSLMSVWKELVIEKLIQENAILNAEVHYQIAKLFGISKQNDSSTFYLAKAYNLLDNNTDNLEVKVKIYQGMGNIAQSESMEQLADYYYNNAASIVLANDNLPLSVNAKVTILVAAAQSNLLFLRYDLSLELNKKALELSQELSAGHPYRQRTLNQLINSLYYLKKDPDSIAFYVKQLEEIHTKHPDSYDDYFLYSCKSLYFERIGQIDSALKYEKLMADYQVDILDSNAVSDVNVNNLFVAYVNIANYLTRKEDYKNAQLHFNKAIELEKRYPKTIDKKNIITYYDNLTVLYKFTGNIYEAFSSSEKTIALHKELFIQQNTKAIAEMNSLYEMQAKEKSISELNENIRIKDLQYQQSKMWLWISILGAIVLLLSLLFLFYAFQQRKVRENKDKIILQQQLLRAQIEPHFIFNTLTALQSYIRSGQKEEAIDYLGSFSKLLRSSMELSREQLVSLESEIEALKHYLLLQKMRFDNAFTYSFILEDELDTDGIKIPPMLIQPYVENAILHGIDMQKGNGTIIIKIKEDKDILIIDITDSGRENLKKGNSHRSLSGEISRERLALLGRKARIDTKKNNEGGTTITICIPIT